MTRSKLLLVSLIGVAATALPSSRALADDDDVKKVVASPAHCAVSIHPNGSITYASDADPNTFCLADDPNSTSTWGADPKAVKVSRRTLTGDLERLGYDAGGTKKPLEPGHVYSIPFDASDSANIVIQGRPALADPAALEKLQLLVETDKDLAKSVDTILQAEGSDDDGRAIIESDVADVSKSDWWPMFGGPLPKSDGKLAPLLTLDATGNTSRSDNRYSDGTFVRGWAYNLSCASDQAIDFAKVSAVSSANPLVSIIASVIAANPAKAFGLGALVAPPPPTQPASRAAKDAIKQLVAAAWRKHLPDVHQIRRCTTALKTTILDGGFNYAFEAVSPATGDGASKQPAQVTGSLEFKTYGRHRIVSVAAELAYGKSINGFPDSGYGYQPIALSGPDQLYQLQELNHFQDTITSSALLLWYPVSTFGTARACAGESTQWLCTDGFVFGFGPTLLRGGTAEFAKQWNTRIGWEIVPNVLLLTGLSWRSIDVPNLPNASLGSTVSVPRPASTPSPGTEPRTDLLWSVGLAVDLNVVANAVTAVSKAVTSSANGAN